MKTLGLKGYLKQFLWSKRKLITALKVSRHHIVPFVEKYQETMIKEDKKAWVLMPGTNCNKGKDLCI